MPIPTEPIGSIPRSKELLAAITARAAGRMSEEQFRSVEETALRDTISRFEQTGSPVITDGEQSKSSFATYPLAGLSNLASDGVVIPFADGHTRQLPRLTAGPFRYGVHAASFLQAARHFSKRPLKQAVISVSALSLLYPANELPDYPREKFLDDLVVEGERDIRECLTAGAHCVQVDFTEARLALKLDPSGGLLTSFIDLNNRVLNRFNPEDRRKIGVHTCPGGDKDSTHSADVDYAFLLPHLFRLNAGRFYVQLSSEPDLPPGTMLFIGVTDPINPRVESAAEVRDRLVEAVEFLDTKSLGTTDDCGFSPFCDDASTSRETAFAKIRSRVEGTNLSADVLKA